VGGLLVAYGVIGLAWPFAPMHLRGTEWTLTDTMHIVLATVTVLLMLLAIGFGAAAFGKRFRRYSIATLAILVAFGALSGLDVPGSRQTCRRRGWGSGNASTSAPSCSGSWCWPSLSYTAKWNGPKTASVEDVIPDELRRLLRDAV
jgi:hypothetical protein